VGIFHLRLAQNNSPGLAANVILQLILIWYIYLVMVKGSGRKRQGLPGGALPAWAAVVIVAAAAVLPFLNTFRNDFVNYDDNRFILENPAIRTFSIGKLPAMMGWSFTPGQETVEACPLTRVTWALNYRLHGYEPWGYHLGNLVLHAAACVLLLLLLRFGPWGAGVAFWAAVLFAVHPVHVESVTWMAARKDVLSGTLAFASMIFYLRFAGSRTTVSGILWWAAAALAWTASFYAKPVAIVVPGLLAAWIVFIGPRGQVKKGLLGLLPMVPGGAVFIWTLAGAFSRYDVVKTYLGGSFWSAQFTNGYILLRYLELLFMPVRMCVNHAVRPPEGWTDPLYLSGWIAILVLGVVFAYFARGRRRLWFFPAWFLISLAPVLQVVPTAVYMADRYLYIPSVVFCVGIAAAAGRIAGNVSPTRPRAPAVAALVLGVLAFSYASATVVRNTVWRDSESLWLDTLERNPRSIHAATNLGLFYMKKGEYENAEKYLLDAIDIWPGSFEPYVNLGTMNKERGNYPEAVRYYLKALEIRPDDQRLVKNLALAYFLDGDFDEAASYMGSYVSNHPREPAALEILCHARVKAGMYEEALEPCSLLMEIRPDDARTLLMYAGAVYKTGQMEKAASLYHRYIRINPGNDAPAYVNLGLCHFFMGQKEEAARMWRRALEFDPGNEKVRYFLDALEAGGINDE